MLCDNCSVKNRDYSWYTELQLEFNLCNKCVADVLDVKIHNLNSQIEQLKIQRNKLKEEV